MTNTNRMILDQLISVPDSQLSLRLRTKCKDFNGTDEELVDLFEEIYNSCCESSSFIKQVVNPEFTRKHLDTDLNDDDSKEFALMQEINKVLE